MPINRKKKQMSDNESKKKILTVYYEHLTRKLYCTIHTYVSNLYSDQINHIMLTVIMHGIHNTLVNRLLGGWALQ